MSDNLDDLSFARLKDFAATAFGLGMADARYGIRIKTSEAVMDVLFPAGWSGIRIHRRKFRQVYGAGFDIGAARERAKHLAEAPT